MNAQDFLLNDDGDMLIANGDLVVGDSDKQHQWDIIVAHKGWYKEFPYIGVGLMAYLKSTGMQLELKKNIQLQLQADNYSLNNLTVGDLDKMEIEWDAERNI